MQPLTPKTGHFPVVWQKGKYHTYDYAVVYVGTFYNFLFESRGQHLGDGTWGRFWTFY